LKIVLVATSRQTNPSFELTVLFLKSQLPSKVSVYGQAYVTLDFVIEKQVSRLLYSNYSANVL